MPFIHRLPDGVGTNWVVAEVPKFPLMNFIGICDQNVTTYYKLLQMLQNVATGAHIKQNITKCKEIWSFCENPVCPEPIWKPVIHRQLGMT